MEEDWKPKVGMEFDNFEDAWKFWVDYGGKIGFGGRKQYTKKRKDGSIGACRFVCCKEGLGKEDKRDYKTINPRPETRTDCKVRIGFINVKGKLRVHDFVEKHNHILHTPETIHMLPCQRKLTEVQSYQIDLADNVGLQQRKSFNLMSQQAGGRSSLGYTVLDQKNYLRTRRQRSLIFGEAGYLIEYFQTKVVEESNFVHSYQMDSEELMTNVFWADSRMLVDYGYFGDVISLDSTYGTNSSFRPLAVFSGFNHHRGTVIFGVALLYDETTDSYKWLLETFLKAHKGKMPQTIFTDQDQSMAKAIQEVMPNTYHGLCTWHLMQNCIKHLGNLIKDESHFLSDFSRCMYGYDDEMEFEEGWNDLLSKYDVHDNTWLQRVYSIKEKWACSYMKKAFTLGIRSTQLSESVNADIKSVTNVKLDIVKFLKHFEQLVEYKRYNELECEYDSRQKNPRLINKHSSILQQMSKLYTPTLFNDFQQEYALYEATCVKSRVDTPPLFEFVITMRQGSGEWRVSFDEDIKSICCSCRKFETVGLLCCHALRVIFMMDVQLIPDQYILKRWTKEAKRDFSNDGFGNHVERDARLSITQRLGDICRKFMRIATESCTSEETYNLLQKVLAEAGKQITEIKKRQSGMNNERGAPMMNTNDNQCHTQVKGFKKREGKKVSKRPKGWVERNLPKNKKNGYTRASQCQQPSMHGDSMPKKKKKDSAKASQCQESFMHDDSTISPVKSSILQVGASHTYMQQHTNTLTQFVFPNFTNLLMAQLDHSNQEDITRLSNP